jgi:hypothetical protein
MSEAYTMFWTHDRCDALRKLGRLGKPLDVLFGGPHISEPSFRRAGVRSDDEVYPVAVKAGILYVLCRIRVARVLSLENYVAAHRDLFAPYLVEPPAWFNELREARHTLVDFDAVQARDALNHYCDVRPELRYLAPTCTDEVVECEDGTPLRLDVAVPPDLLLRLRYRSQRGERDLHKYIRDGRLIQSLGVQGIYRLSEPSARDVAALVASSPPVATD